MPIEFTDVVSLVVVRMRCYLDISESERTTGLVFENVRLWTDPTCFKKIGKIFRGILKYLFINYTKSKDRFRSIMIKHINVRQTSLFFSMNVMLIQQIEE